MSGPGRSPNTGQSRASAFARGLALCLCLAIALIAANLIYNALARRADALAGADGELLYLATFAAQIDDWDLYAGKQSARIAAEQLEIAVGDPQTAAWSAASPRFSDFDVTVEAVAHDGPIDNAFGIVFYADDAVEGNCKLPAILLCGISELMPLAGAAIRQALDQHTTGYGAFMISSDGYYSLWKAEAGATKALSAWISSPRINQGLGALNTIRVVAIGSEYRFYINGSRVQLCIPNDAQAESTFAGGECIDGSLQDAYYDTTKRSGKLGLMAQSTATGGGGVVIRFDDLIVYSPVQPGSEDARL